MNTPEPTLAERLEQDRPITMAQLMWEKKFNDFVSTVCTYQSSLSFWDTEFSRLSRSKSKQKDLESRKIEARHAVRRIQADLAAHQERFFAFCRDNPYPKDPKAEQGGKAGGE